jgi:hypothetical protein
MTLPFTGQGQRRRRAKKLMPELDRLSSGTSARSRSWRPADIYAGQTPRPKHTGFPMHERIVALVCPWRTACLCSFRRLDPLPELHFMRVKNAAPAFMRSKQPGPQPCRDI